MKMKKVLAAVFALTIVGANLGLAAFAEEAAVVTEDSAVISEEVVSTEPVIVEETAEETTEATEEAADETTEAATEEDEVIEAETEDETNSFENLGSTLEDSDENDIKTAVVTIGDKTFIVKNESGYVENAYYPVKMYLSVYFEDGTATNLQNIIVAEDVSFGGNSHEYVYTVTNHFTVSNNVITIKSIANGDISYEFDNETNSFVKTGSSSENDKPEVTEAMLYDKFVSEYGEPDDFTFGDFNNDGKSDAYAFILDDKMNLICYFVTVDGITFVSSDEIGANAGPTYYYFESGDCSFRVTFYVGGGNSYVYRDIYISKINSNGTLTPCTISGENCKIVVNEQAEDGEDSTNFECWSVLTSDQVNDASTFIKSNGDYITITVYDFEKGIIGASTNYVFDSASNNFVVGTSLTGGSQGGSSAGSSGTVSNSPATSDSMSIPAVAASAIVVMGSVIYVSKKRK